MSAEFVQAYRRNDAENRSYRQYANSRDGEGVTITYTFETADFRQVGELMQHALKDGMAIWSRHANVIFKEAAPGEKGDIVIVADPIGWHWNSSRINEGPPYLTRPGQHLKYNKTTETIDADVHSRSGEPVVWFQGEKFYYHGRGAYETLLMAGVQGIGYLLGLNRPVPSLDEAEARQSVMAFSYPREETWGYQFKQPLPFRPGLFDQIAIQSIYGPNESASPGNDTYDFGASKLIDDAGGHDTITAASEKSGVYLDLNDGTWNWVGKKAGSLLSTGQFWIGHFTRIEDAAGSRFNDTIVGNERGNSIKGGAGHDTLSGGAGGDELYGEAGNDIFEGGAGGDTIHVGSGNDRIVIKAFSHLGTLVDHDQIVGFTGGDRIDFRGIDPDRKAGDQKLKFLGNSNSDVLLAGKKAGQFYYNTDSQELRFDANGNGVVDHALEVAGLKTMKAGYFIL
jgi:hypothetical protein